MRQAIVTKYHGPTNYKPSRITARADAGSITVSYDNTLDNSGNHEVAAYVLMRKLGWTGKLVGGGLPGVNAGYCFVIVGV